MDPQYKHVHLVDPSKVKVSIKDKFSKLTLSSNKKQENKIREQVNNDVIIHTQDRKSASRNLLSDFLSHDIPPNVMNDPNNDLVSKQVNNPLFQTDSSSSIISEDINDLDKTNFSQRYISRSLSRLKLDNSIEMEKLHISEEFSQISASQKTSNNKEISAVAISVEHSVAMCVNPTPLNIISSEDANVSQIISTESQRLSSCNRNTQLLSIANKNKDEVVDQTVSICISSSEESSRVASPITISDSLNSYDAVSQCERRISSVLSRDIESSSILNNAKADHMNAFLRDVHASHKKCQITDATTESMTQFSADEEVQPSPPLSKNRNLTKAKIIATADTESMTPENESEICVIPETMPGVQSSHKPNNPRCFDPDKQLAFKDTEDMTNNSFSRNQNGIALTHQESDEIILNNSAPDDSLTVAETSSEQESMHILSRSPSIIDNADKKSQLSSPHSSSTSWLSSSHIHMNMPKINFSAKINFKIHISSCSSNSASDTEQDDKDSRKESKEAKEHDNIILSDRSNSSQRSKTNEGLSPPTQDIPQEGEALLEVSNSKASSGEDNESFLKHAENLLNQLYGNTWRTPEVVHRLGSSTKRQNKEKENTVPRLLKKKDETMKTPIKSLKKVSRSKLAGTNPCDDFSIFQQNIKENFESTRFTATISPSNDDNREPTKKSVTERKEKKNSVEKISNIPRTEGKRKITRKVRQNKQCELWRDGDYTESESENASCDSSYIETDSSYDSENERRGGKPVRKTKVTKGKQQNNKEKTKTNLIYLDLTKDEVEIQKEIPSSPPANHDWDFQARLQKLLQRCNFEDKPKLPATPTTKTKRKLFTPNFDYEEYEINDDKRDDKPKSIDTREMNLLKDREKQSAENDLLDHNNVHLNVPLPKKYTLVHKQLESVKQGVPIFKIPTPKVYTKKTPFKTPERTAASARSIETIAQTPEDKYGFLKSLDVCVGKSYCHPDALYYRENFRTKKEELANKLLKMYNEKLFNNKLYIQIKWNKKLINTAGRCLCKTKMGIRSSVIELSEKVITSADRLRCTLIHELCHAATWVFDNQDGHGAVWKEWARRANEAFPELPRITVCHQYEIEYKYTYKCTLCGAKSHAHSKSRKVENIRCSFCHGRIEIFLNKKDKDGNLIPTPVREPTGFAKFVKEKYNEYKQPDLKLGDVMKILSNEYAALKLGNANGEQK